MYDSRVTFWNASILTRVTRLISNAIMTKCLKNSVLRPIAINLYVYVVNLKSAIRTTNIYSLFKY